MRRGVKIDAVDGGRHRSGPSVVAELVEGRGLAPGDWSEARVAGLPEHERLSRHR